MKLTIKRNIIRSFKKIPYFFTRKDSYLYQNNYALMGKLSTSLLHDVLSPLTSLSMATELAHNHSIHTISPIINNSTEQIKEYVDIMRGFLMEKKTITKPVHINSEILKCITLIKHKAIQNNIQIQFLEFDQIYSKVHPINIYQIIINLLTNAIEASIDSTNKKVILILKKHEDTFVLECKDFGAGIPQHIIQKIGTYNFSTKSKSRGFGLYSINYILKNILNGSLSVQSENKCGTLFVCTLPIIK